METCIRGWQWFCAEEVFSVSVIIKYECHFPSNKESACKAGDPGSIPRSERSPGGGHGHPLQYSCLENPVDRGAWRATVHRVVNSRTRLKQLSRKAGHLSTMVISGLIYKPSKGFTFGKPTLNHHGPRGGTVVGEHLKFTWSLLRHVGRIKLTT